MLLAVRSVARRGVWRDGARAARAFFVSGRALKSKRVCARGPRGRLGVVGWTKNEYCAAIYGSNAASLRAALAVEAGELG